jgi:CRISPR-associated protein Csd1
MMLQGLIKYAERENLGDADFASVGVRWEISLMRDGSFAGLIPLSENPDEKKPRAKQMLRPFSSTNELAQGKTSYFLCDSLERAVLFLDAKAPEKNEARIGQHQYFKVLLREAGAACDAERARLDAVSHFLDDQKALVALHLKLTAAKAKPTDNVLFSVDGVNLLRSEELKQFWRDRRRRLASSNARERRICIATGELAETLDTTEKIKGVPGGLAMGTNLISFDKDSFCSFGLEQAQNAALSAPAELKIRSALNQLIARSREQGLVFNEAIYLHWTREPVEHDPIDLLSGADENKIEQLLKSVKEGKCLSRVGENGYFMISLSGNGARIVVRDWIESTVQEVEENIAKWFEDLGIIDPDGSGPKRDFKFGALLYGLVRAKLEELPPALPTQLLHSALTGLPLPHAALAAAVRRQQLDLEDKLNPRRIALIKACLIRTNPKDTKNMTSLNPELPNAAYHCGRLFAVFDRLQYLAQGSVNAGVVERYYASASVTPSLVMGRLFRTAQFHLAKVGGGTETNIEKDFEALSEIIGKAFPETLDLEAQGRFALGYYHQKAEYRRRSAERKQQALAAESVA